MGRLLETREGKRRQEEVLQVLEVPEVGSRGWFQRLVLEVGSRGWHVRQTDMAGPRGATAPKKQWI